MKVFTKITALACGNEGLCDVCYCQREFVRGFLSFSFSLVPAAFVRFICMLPLHPIEELDSWLAYIFFYFPSSSFSFRGVVFVQGQSVSEEPAI
jgi:hypothetical protein